MTFLHVQFWHRESSPTSLYLRSTISPLGGVSSSLRRGSTTVQVVVSDIELVCLLGRSEDMKMVADIKT